MLDIRIGEVARYDGPAGSFTALVERIDQHDTETLINDVYLVPDDSHEVVRVAGPDALPGSHDWDEWAVYVHPFPELAGWLLLHLPAYRPEKPVADVRDHSERGLLWEGRPATREQVEAIKILLALDLAVGHDVTPRGQAVGRETAYRLSQAGEDRLNRAGRR